MAQAMGANTQSNVVKPKDSNILSKTLDEDLNRMKASDRGVPFSEDDVTYIKSEIERLKNGKVQNPMVQQNLLRLQDDLARNKKESALNTWIDSNLANYVKKQMATPDDPVRKLAEEGITHNQEFMTPIPADAFTFANREQSGFPKEGLAQSPLAKTWENQSDDALVVYRAGDIQAAPENIALTKEAQLKMHAAQKNLNDNLFKNLTEKGLSESEIKSLQSMSYGDKAAMTGDTDFESAYLDYMNKLNAQNENHAKLARENPWVSKLDPETKLYQPYTGGLGFDHIIDVLREDLTTGRIRPEQLNKVSMEQAVRRTAEYDQELAAKMNAAKAATREGLPVYKEYPEGYRWVELNKPGSFASESEAMGHSVRGYEPPKGHPDWTEGSGDSGSRNYGHGGWEAIKSGKAKVYSLVDSKGEPHTTIEVAQVEKHPIGYSLERGVEFPKDFRYERGTITPEQKQQIYQRAKELFDPESTKGLTDFSQHRMDVFQQAADEVIGKPPDMITQIKGKQNRAPSEEYLPFVQDFVRSGKWSDVDDLQKYGAAAYL
jgi:hypothetical protein